MKYIYRITNKTSIMFIFVLFAAACIIMPLSGCKKEEVKETSKKAKPVETIAVKEGAMALKVGFTGNLFSKNEVSVVPREAGQVDEIFVDEGDIVTEGQILLKLNDDRLLAQKMQMEAELAILQNQYQQAVLNLDLQDSTVSVGINQADQSVLQAEFTAEQTKLKMEQAKIDLVRQDRLYQKGAVSKQSLENAQLDYDTALKQYETSQSMIKNAGESLKMAEANTIQKSIRSEAVQAVQGQIEAMQASIALLDISIRDSEVKAPFSGVVSYRDKSIAKSSMVTSNTASPVFKIVDNSNLYMEGVISEGKIAAVKPGSPVVVLMDAFPNKTFNGTVETIVSAIDLTSMSFVVRVKVSNASDELKNGMFGRAEIALEELDGFIVPFSGIMKRPDLLETPEPAVDRPHMPINELDPKSVYTLYVAENGKAIRKDVIVKVVTQDAALVTQGVTKKDNLSIKDKLIITSVKTLQNNEPIQIVKDLSVPDKSKKTDSQSEEVSMTKESGVE